MNSTNNKNGHPRRFRLFNLAIKCKSWYFDGLIAFAMVFVKKSTIYYNSLICIRQFGELGKI